MVVLKITPQFFREMSRKTVFLKGSENFLKDVFSKLSLSNSIYNYAKTKNF